MMTKNTRTQDPCYYNRHPHSHTHSHTYITYTHNSYTYIHIYTHTHIHKIETFNSTKPPIKKPVTQSTASSTPCTYHFFHPFTLSRNKQTHKQTKNKETNVTFSVYFLKDKDFKNKQKAHEASEMVQQINDLAAKII